MGVDQIDRPEDMNIVEDNYTKGLRTGRFFESTSRGIRPAGTTQCQPNDTTAQDVQPDIFFPLPDTPRTVAKWRKNQNPGCICVHPGNLGDPLPDETFSYGAVPKGNRGSVKQVFDNGLKTSIEEFQLGRAEAKYKSNIREPLGGSYVRGHIFHKSVHEEGFCFGAESGEKNMDAKSVIFPRGTGPDSDEVRAQYLLTHHNYAMGEQKQHGYNLPQEIKDMGHDFSYGKADPLEVKNGVAKCFAWDKDEDEKGNMQMKKTEFVKNAAEARRTVCIEPLGQRGNYKQFGMPPVDRDHAFGKTSRKSGASGQTVADALMGSTRAEDLAPENDLGRCQIPGRRNITENGGRSYGTPSIRYDIPKPASRSCADQQNYGDEVGADALLNPQRFELMGVPDSDFLIRRNKDELHKILSAVGFEMLDKYERMFEKACALHGDNDPVTSLDAILKVYQDQIRDDIAKDIGEL